MKMNKKEENEQLYIVPFLMKQIVIQCVRQESCCVVIYNYDHKVPGIIFILLYKDSAYGYRSTV